MTTLTETSTADLYAEEVQAALSDLPVEDRDDLLEDLRGHLAELVAEDPSVDLVARLGEPAAYAHELRTAAGLPPRTGSSSPVRDRFRDLQAAVVALVAANSAGRFLRDFLPSLRPAWWLLRVYGVIWLVDSWFNDGPVRWGRSVVPYLHDEQGYGFIALGLLAVGSVAVARSERFRQGALRWAVLGANIVLVVATPAYFVDLGSDAGSDYYSPAPAAVSNCCGYLYNDSGSGSTITNIYGYDANGKRLDRVQLFDQDGYPLDIQGNDPLNTQLLHNVYPQPSPPIDVVPQQDPAVNGADGIVSPPVPETVPLPTIAPGPAASVAPLPKATPTR